MKLAAVGLVIGAAAYALALVQGTFATGAPADPCQPAPGVVTDFSDNAANPASGSLRYELTHALGGQTISFCAKTDIFLHAEITIDTKPGLTLIGGSLRGGTFNVDSPRVTLQNMKLGETRLVIGAPGAGLIGDSFTMLRPDEKYVVGAR
jgi:hypothetical protein